MKEVLIYKEYPLLLPEGELADWDVFDYWEKPRFESMKEHLRSGDLMFDVGAEHGWLSALYAKYLGIKMTLFEPSEYFWPSIRAIWEYNGIPNPEGCFVGLVGNEETPQSRITYGPWPPESKGKLLTKGMPYKYLHNSKPNDRKTTIDYWLKTHSSPQALNIDVEGAELEVLRGSERTLDQYKPLVWLSIHPDLLEKDYKTTASKVHGFMEEHGYEGELLETSHEEHWIFKP